ncbi:MAG TPA: outer membrane protein assembly factor BamE [Alcanivoracaceae bacterium]|nr:outer membrane protein assembly factor BamE [Alcanivoracaceae bacterium]
MRKNTSIAIILLTSLFLASCSSLRFPGVYRIDIPQGNYITQDMLQQLKPGMTPDQVKYLLGEPILVDLFTANAWYYPLIYQPGRGETTEQRIVVYFQNSLYSHYEGVAAEDLSDTVIAEQDKELERRLQEQKRSRQAADKSSSPISIDSGTHTGGMPPR